MERKRLIFIIVIGAVVLLAGGLFALSIQQGWIKIGAEEEEETGVTEEKSGACYFIKKDSDPKCFEFCEDMDEDKCYVQDAIFLEGRNCDTDPQTGIVLGMYPLCDDIGCCIKSYWWNSAPRDQAPRFMNAVNGIENVIKQICEQYDEGGPRTTYYYGQTFGLPPGPPPGWTGDWHPEKMAAWLVENEECSSHLICNQKNMCILKKFPGDTDERCEDKKDGETCKEESSDESPADEPADEPAEESPDEE